MVRGLHVCCLSFLRTPSWFLNTGPLICLFPMSGSWFFSNDSLRFQWATKSEDVGLIVCTNLAAVSTNADTKLPRGETSAWATQYTRWRHEQCPIDQLPAKFTAQKVLAMQFIHHNADIVLTISPTSSLFVAQRSSTYSQGTRRNFGRLEVGWEKVACWSTKAAISLKGVNIDEKLLWTAYTDKAHRTVIFAIAQLSCYIGRTNAGWVITDGPRQKTGMHRLQELLFDTRNIHYI